MRDNGRQKPRKIPEVLTESEQVRFLAQLEPTDTISKLRNFTMLRVMLNQGLRISELIALRLRDLDRHTGEFYVRQGKGKKDRRLRLAVEDLALIKDWLAHRPGPARPQDLLFTSLDGQRPICGRWFYDLVRRLAQRAGIAKKIGSHSLRHTFATDLLRRTGNLAVVMRAMGHAHISTTTIYTQIVDEELDDALMNLRNGKEL